MLLNDDSNDRYQTLEDPWYEPLPSLASRKISLKSKGAGRALIPALTGSPPAVRLIQCESILEGKCVMVLLVHRDIINIVEQPPAVDYFDEDVQKWRRHTFDFLVHRTDGARIALAVRVEDRIKDLEYIVKTIAGQVIGFADFYGIVTDADLPDNMVTNSQLILSARTDIDRSADDKVRAIVKTLNGTTTIGAIVAASGLQGDAFRAMVRLIDAGEVEIGRNILIDYRAFIRRPTTTRVAA